MTEATDQAAYAERRDRQIALLEWAQKCFTPEEASNPVQRGLRFLEEAIELGQAVNVDKEMLHTLVDYVYSRPIGDVRQEAGGVGVSLLLLCEAHYFTADEEEKREVERLLRTPPEKFTQRNAEKNKAGFSSPTLNMRTEP